MIQRRHRLEHDPSQKFAVVVVNMNVAAGDRLSTKQKHNRPDVSCPRENLHAVIGRVGGVAVEQPFGQTFQRTTQKQDYRGESDRNAEHKPVTEPADEAKHRADPNRRGCR